MRRRWAERAWPLHSRRRDHRSTLAAKSLSPESCVALDPDPVRAALVKAWPGRTPLEVGQAVICDEHGGPQAGHRAAAADRPDRDTLESLQESSVANPRPVVMFVDRSEPGLAEAGGRASSPPTSSTAGRPIASGQSWTSP